MPLAGLVELSWRWGVGSGKSHLVAVYDREGWLGRAEASHTAGQGKKEIKSGLRPVLPRRT